jgi:Flp pilus assembly protein TadG
MGIFRMRRGQDGAAAVEFALVLPVLITLLFGIIQFGWYFFVANSASSSAREAARRVVVGDCWAGEFEPFVKKQAPTTTSATYSPGNLSDASVTVGDPVTITVVADGAIIDFIPWGASGGQVTREFTARLEDKTAGSCS